MPDTTSFSRNHPGAIMTIFNLQIKMTLWGPTLINRNRNTIFISFPRKMRKLHELSAHYTVFEWKAFCIPPLNAKSCFFFSVSLPITVYPHPDLVKSWINSCWFHQEQHCSFPIIQQLSCCILYLLIWPYYLLFCLKELAKFHSSLYIFFLSCTFVLLQLC